MITPEKGSMIAKNGFKNELDIIKIFNNWNTDKIAQTFLETMGYNISDISSIHSYKIKKNLKPDICVEITLKNSTEIKKEYISIKLVSNKVGFNQIDKRWTDTYKELFNIPEDITNTLKLYCGEIKHNVENSKNKKRLFLDEIDEAEVSKLIDFLDSNKDIIMRTIFQGTSDIQANWFLVAKKSSSNGEFALKNTDTVISTYSNGLIYTTKRGNLRFGQVSIQRKGGDGGRKTANMLQFKINPLLLLDT